MTGAPSVSVVIPTYDRPKELARCLEGLAAQTRPPLEVLIVDDGSPTDYADELADRTPGVRVLRQRQGGPAQARHRGAQAARGDVVALCDDDVVPPSDWLEQAIRCYVASGAVGVEGATSPPADVRPDHARVQLNTGGSFLTCNLLLRRDALVACVPDPRFRRPFREDSDLAESLQRRFGPIVFCAEARMEHPTSQLSFHRLLVTAGWHYYDGLILRRHGAGTLAIGSLTVRLPGHRHLLVRRPKQRLAVLQLGALATSLLGRGSARDAGITALAVTTVAATAYEQRYWVRAALRHDPTRLRSPDYLTAALHQAAEQSVANLVRGASYLAGRVRWSVAPRTVASRDAG